MPSFNAGVLFVAIATVQVIRGDEIRGRVISESGEGLSGVLVSSMPNAETNTNEAGQFMLEKPAALVRFSASGYRPVTKRLRDLGYFAEVTLRADPQGLWVPPPCSGVRPSRVVSGDLMQFNLVSGVKLSRGRDIDYQTNLMCRHKSCMEHGWGPLWSFGMPPSTEFPAAFSDIRERDVQIRPDVMSKGNEYRAMRSDGTQMRFVGIFDETIAYDHAPKEAAEHFDKIIDTLCWRSNRR